MAGRRRVPVELGSTDARRRGSLAWSSFGREAAVVRATPLPAAPVRPPPPGSALDGGQVGALAARPVGQPVVAAGPRIDESNRPAGADGAGGSGARLVRQACTVTISIGRLTFRARASGNARSPSSTHGAGVQGGWCRRSGEGRRRGAPVLGAGRGWRCPAGLVSDGAGDPRPPRARLPAEWPWSSPSDAGRPSRRRTAGGRSRRRPLGLAPASPSPPRRSGRRPAARRPAARRPAARQPSSSAQGSWSLLVVGCGYPCPPPAWWPAVADRADCWRWR